MDSNNLTVIPPEEGETVEEYIGRYTDEELDAILMNPDLSVEYSRALMFASRHVRSPPADELQRLWDQIRIQDNFGQLLHLLEKLKPVRIKLLDSLGEAANHIEKYAKYGNATKLLSSATDIAGTVGGLCMKDSKCDFSNLAFTTATAFGFLGVWATLAENYFSKRLVDDVMRDIQHDEQLATVVREWFSQTIMLKRAFKAIFPVETTYNIMRDLITAVGIKFSGISLLTNLLQRIIRDQGVEGIKNALFLGTMSSLCSRSDSDDFFQWMIFQESPIYLDVARVVLQFQYSPRFALCQSIPALSPKHQTLWSFPVWGRLSFNFMSMFNALEMLRRPEICTVAYNMKRLKEDLAAEWINLDKILQYVKKRNNINVNPLTIN